ncbi:MAG: type I-E CRISPR-associated protein Cas6/Cse3/CasE [Anaerolineae bacterium]|jgi:CRISPR system Cascade subunit CasE
MHLSRLILNPRNRRVQREVASPYQLHRSLMRAFPDGLKEGQERVLFRLEEHPRTGALTLLVQSLNPPDWSWLQAPNARDYLLPEHLLPPGVYDNPATKPFDLALSPGQVLAFRLRANPTVKRKFPNGDHKRVGLYREEEQIQWLERKAELGGFDLLSARTGRQDIIRGQLKRDDKTHQLRLLSVQFDGVLRVSDPERLCESVRRGIGSGKGMGFGLLSLAPPG